MDQVDYLRVDFVIDHLARAVEFIRREAPVVLRHVAEMEFANPCQMESPLEAAFKIWWDAVAIMDYPAYRLELRPQREVVVEGSYFRLDFTVQPGMSDWLEIRRDAERFELAVPLVAIEVDGHDFHERTKEQVAVRDRRDRALQAAGWRVFHFSGSEFHRTPETSVRGVYDATFRIYRDFYFTILNHRYPDAG